MRIYIFKDVLKPKPFFISINSSLKECKFPLQRYKVHNEARRQNVLKRNALIPV